MSTPVADCRYIVWLIFVTVVIGCSGGGELNGRTSPDTAETESTRPGEDTGTTVDSGAADTDTRQTVRDTGAAADTCPEGDPRDIPASTVGRLVATPVDADGVAIEGRLDETSASALAFGDPTGESDNEVALHARWTRDFLYLGADVEDGSLETGSSVGRWEDDSIEIAFDTDGDGGAEVQRDDRKMTVDIDGTSSTGQGQDGNWVGEPLAGVEMDSQSDQDGYVAEFRIPWDAIGGFGQAAADEGPGFIIVVNDRDDGEAQRFSWTGANDELQQPSAWGTIHLAEPPCSGKDLDAGDTGGMDTSDEDATDDSDADDGSNSRLGPPRYVKESDFNFQTTLNAVDDLGMDPTGQEPIDDKLDQARDSNTLIEFPPGTYKIEAGPGRDATHNWGSEARHFGMKGLGDEPKDVQFVVEQQPADYGGRWIQDHGGEGVMFKNFAIQMTRDDYTSADIWIKKDDLVLVEKVEWAGLIPVGDHANSQLLTFEITDESGVGEVNRLYIREGAKMPGYPEGTAGLRIQPGHVGTAYLTDMWLESLGSSAFRFTKVPGRVGVEGGYFKNNANTNMRGSAGQHPDGPSYIRGATVVVDTEATNDYQPADQELTPTQLLRVDSSGRGFSGMIIEEVDMYLRNAPEGTDVIARPGFGDHGAFTFRDSHIYNATSGVTTLIGDVSKPSDETARFENIHVSGPGSGELQAESSTSAEIVDSCVESNFSIEGYDVVDNVDRSGCETPDAPEGPPHDH